jgi:CubicO group peptidase (beta-lactamase class C family)
MLHAKVNSDANATLRIILVAVPLLWGFVTTAHAQYYPPPENAGGWRRLVNANTTPNLSQKATIRTTAGLDWDVLKQAWNATSKYGGTFLVIRNGWIAAEWGSVTTPKQIASCTKTLTSLAMHRMFQMSASGKFTNVIAPEDLAYLYLPPSWGENATRRTISIRHLLTMSSGLEPHDNPPSPSSSTAAYRQLLLNPPVRTAPGVEWSYASLPVDVLSLVTERVTGKTLADFFRTEIGSKIGASSVKWGALGSHTYASAYSSMTSRDLARISYLLLRRGSWQGKRIVSGARIDSLTSWDPALGKTVYGEQVKFPTDPNSHKRFGRLTWTNRTQSSYVGTGVPSDAYYCAGFGTKFAMVIPSLDMIVVRNQDGPTPWSDSVFKNITTLVMRAVVDD